MPGRAPAAVLAALHLENGSPDKLAALSDTEWQAALKFADRAQLTLLLTRLDPSVFPSWVAERLACNLADNAQHNAKIRAGLYEIADALENAGIEFVSLKGFANGRDFFPGAQLRVQYDIDLFCPQNQLSVARGVIERLNYAPVKTSQRFPIDHLPVMVRWNNWKRTANQFDPEMPLAVDIHHRFWDPSTERFDAPGAGDFWSRRTIREIDGHVIPVLARPDALAYAALHALRHWFRGTLKPAHIFELAYFLHTHSDDDRFWGEWRSEHSPELRRIEAIPFRLAREWFGGRESAAVREEIAALPPAVHTWFARWRWSPVEAMFSPDKSDLWLHLSLVRSLPDKLRVVRRRVLPLAVMQSSTQQRLVRTGKYFAFLWERGTYHARAVFPTLWNGLTWLLLRPSSKPPSDIGSP